MKGGLPKTKKVTVYVYPTSGHWTIRYSSEQAQENLLYRTANEALQAARAVFRHMGAEAEIIICNQKLDDLRLSA